MAFMENKCQAAVTLDIEKAFDLMWTTGTLTKLNDFGINGKMFNWIHNFLNGRKIQVRVGMTHLTFTIWKMAVPRAVSLVPSYLMSL